MSTDGSSSSAPACPAADRRARSEGDVPERSPYEAVVDPAKYRAPDCGYAPCEHGFCGTLCSTAGKVGRNGRTAAIGATLFWLTCPSLNNIIARFERHGIISALTTQMATDESLREAHVSSHATYEALVGTLLSDEQAAFFRLHFMSDSEPTKRKYGNAAVGHAADLKCLHALAAQSICGSSNPIGNAVLHYILHLEGMVSAAETLAVRSGADASTAVSGIVDKKDGFLSFVEIRGGWAAFVSPPLAVEQPSSEIDGMRCCRAASYVLLAAEGHPPKTRKKHRKN